MEKLIVLRLIRENELFDELARNLDVTYQYEEAKPEPQEESLLDEALENATLSEDLLAKLRTAVNSANKEELEQHIGAVGAHDAPLASRLESLLNQYDYDGITEILDSIVVE